MEERPKRSETPDENESNHQENKVNPGEIFLREWMGPLESSEPEEASSGQQEGSRFTESFRDSVFPKVVSKESSEKLPENDKVIYEKTAGDDRSGRNAAESRFDKRHEAVNKVRDSDDVSAKEASPLKSEPKQDEPSDMHHISSVIGERARDIREESGRSAGNRTRISNTASYFARPVMLGFLSALMLLILILVASLLV